MLGERTEKERQNWIGHCRTRQGSVKEWHSTEMKKYIQTQRYKKNMAHLRIHREFDVAAA